MEKRLVEFKARVGDLDGVRERLLRAGAVHRATVRQVDTYFGNVLGRLKLREWAGGAQLIYYVRPDVRDVKRSFVRLTPVSDPSSLKRVLGETLGVRVVVRKVREIYSWRGVEVHLDRVEGLGSFVEIEWEDGDEEGLRRMMGELGIESSGLIAVSYSDLLGGQSAVSGALRGGSSSPRQG